MMIDQHEKHLTKLDLTAKNLKKIEKFSSKIQFDVAFFDSNEITKIEHLDVFHHLIELSISQNRLIDIRLLSRLKTLEKLNLSHNSIDSVEPLKTLINLTILNVSSNNIVSLSPLSSCVALKSLDASDNSIRQIDDFSHLKSLKLLNLRRNLIDHLKILPKSLEIFIISDNELRDLSETTILSSLNHLKTFALENNPCLFTTNDRYGCHQAFDYRPYVLSWCLTIENLDGLPVTRRESLKAEWLMSQGKGRAFRPGEHQQLVEYLIKVCGTNADERDELHLSRVMIEQDEMKSKNEKLLISESEFFQVSPSNSISNVEQTKKDDSHSHTRYSDYDNRPIKPLDKNLFQTKLKEFPIESNSTSKHLQPKTASHGPTIQSNTKKRPSTVDVPRNSILQAYLDLHQRFARTVELQTSALAALWKKLEEQNATHQKETKMILEENRLLKQRLEQFESRSNSSTIYPPLNAHISKRDQKSFYLHWSSNPLNDQQSIVGYRIYIDDIFKGSTDRDHFEAVIDCIRDEGEYRLKLRTFNHQRESVDSNVVVARFRRQQNKEPMIVKSPSNGTTDLISFSPSSSPPEIKTKINDVMPKSSFDSSTLLLPRSLSSCDRKSC